MKLNSLVAVILLLTLCVGMVACGGENNIQNPSENNDAPTQNEAAGPQNITDETDANTGVFETSEPDEAKTEPDGTTEPDATQKPTEPQTNPSEPTEGTTVPDPTEPPEAVTEPTQPPVSTPDPTAEAYIAYYNMSAAEQQAFIDSFGSIEAFFTWHTAAKKAYEDNRTPIDGSTPILP